MLLEVILSTTFFKSEIWKVQLEARDIPLHAGIFGMPISICVFLHWQFENNQNPWNRRRVTKTFKIPIFNSLKSRHFRCLETLKNTVPCTMMSIYIFNNQISAMSYRFVEHLRYINTWYMVVITLVFGFMYPCGLVDRLPQRGAFIYYCLSFLLCIGGQAALASAGMSKWQLWLF